MGKKRIMPEMREEKIEDVTRYGEFISSFDQWTTYERQKATVEHLQEIAELNQPTNIKRRGYEQLGEQEENEERNQ